MSKKVSKNSLLDAVRHVLVTRSVKSLPKKVVEEAVRLDYICLSAIGSGLWLTRPRGRKALAKRLSADMAAVIRAV